MKRGLGAACALLCRLGLIAVAVAPFGSSLAWASVVSHRVDRGGDRAASYWTAQRMRSAEVRTVLKIPGRAQPATSTRSPIGSALARRRPTPQSGPIDLHQASVSTLGIEAVNSTEYPDRVNGAIFGKSGGVDFECSGSVVVAPNESTVVTAGHCVYDPESDRWSSDVVFIPGYREGEAPFGIWEAETLYSSEGWIESARDGLPYSAYDFGMLKLKRKHEYVEEQLGAFGIAFNQPQHQTYTEYGYPGEPSPYDGEKLWTLTSPLVGLDRTYSPPTLELSSDFGPGTSGGPFVLEPAGEVEAVATYSYVDDPSHIYGTYFGNDIEALYCALSGLSYERLQQYPGDGIAYVQIAVPCDGRLKISGPAIRVATRSLHAFGGNLWVPVKPNRTTALQLERLHRAYVRVNLDFKPVVGEAIREYIEVPLVKRS